jgi:hypothetical protein
VVERPPAKPALPAPEPISQQPVTWHVVGPNRPAKETLYGVTEKDYEILSRNAADVLRWVKEAAWRLDYYRQE